MAEREQRELLCGQCGETFLGSWAEFCSRRCRAAFARKRREERRQAAEQEAGRTCAHQECDESLAGYRPDAIWCSSRCRDRARRQRERADRPADWAPRRGGKPGPRPGARKLQPGARFGQLVLIEYVEPTPSGSMASWECDCGNRKAIAVRNVTRADGQRHCADWSNHPHPQSSGAVITSGGRHQQLRIRYGSASSHPCIACGKVGRGNDYAYLHSSGEERSQLVGKDRGQTFALEDEAYAVLCRGHHMALDRAHRSLVALGAVSGPHVALAALLGGPGTLQPPPADP